MTLADKLLALAAECDARVPTITGDFAGLTQLALRQQATALRKQSAIARRAGL